MDPELPIKTWAFQQRSAEEEHCHRNDHNARDAGQGRLLVDHVASDCTGGQSQQNEHQGKAAYEEKGVSRDRSDTARAPTSQSGSCAGGTGRILTCFRVRSFGCGVSGVYPSGQIQRSDDGKIHRGQRQDARRREGREPAGEGRRDADSRDAHRVRLLCRSRTAL